MRTTVFRSRSASPGFIFIEVVLTIAMVGLLLGSLFTLLSKSVQTITAFSERLSRVYLLNNMFVEARMKEVQNEEMVSQKSVDSPKTMITLKEARPVKESSLATLKNIFIKTATAEWGDQRAPKKEVMVQLVYRAPKKDEKKK